ncbi:hypothetical protein QBC40DRAFT_33624 [Triangularia verruculosa]|uniref:Uncharacterized protein n=1 Tax=Triangularia verruculosa TaxID=2587418 RepID=A0AAN6X9A9_9PEZI|nr:hypothetical protein QBC40DRAFT_33624 [Triangularia verruculosa]
MSPTSTPTWQASMECTTGRRNGTVVAQDRMAEHLRRWEGSLGLELAELFRVAQLCRFLPGTTMQPTKMRFIVVKTGDLVHHLRQEHHQLRGMSPNDCPFWRLGTVSASPFVTPYSPCPLLKRCSFELVLCCIDPTGDAHIAVVAKLSSVPLIPSELSNVLQSANIVFVPFPFDLGGQRHNRTATRPPRSPGFTLSEKGVKRPAGLAIRVFFL